MRKYRVYALEVRPLGLTKSYEIMTVITEGQAQMIRLAVEEAFTLILPDRKFAVMTAPFESNEN